MSFDISTELLRRNMRFKQRKIPLVLELRSNRLMIRGTLPPKPGSPQKQPYRQRLDTGLMPTRLGVQEAEKRLLAVHRSLHEQTFSWDSFAATEQVLGSNQNRLTIENAITIAEHEYFKTRDRTDRKKQHTWYSSYLGLYKQMNPGATLTNEYLREFIVSKPAGHSVRVMAIMACRFLARANKIILEYEDLKTNKITASLKTRKPPSDERIVERYRVLQSYCRNIVNGKSTSINFWKTVLWTYGMMATYGLRTHEVNFIEWNKDNSINVLHHKTDEFYGPRMNIYPFPPDWVDLFSLKKGGVLIRINLDQLEPAGKLTQKVGNGFRKAKIGFVPYDLRHAYALRLMRLKVDHSIAAMMMGHTVEMHMMTYRKWISESLKKSEINKAYRYLEETKKHGY